VMFDIDLESNIPTFFLYPFLCSF